MSMGRCPHGGSTYRHTIADQWTGFFFMDVRVVVVDFAGDLVGVSVYGDAADQAVQDLVCGGGVLRVCELFFYALYFGVVFGGEGCGWGVV